jgi:topoisomerase-4 subunit B
VEVVRDGNRHKLVFSGGDVIEPSPASATPQKASGTSVRAWPDAKYFDAPDLPRAELERLLFQGRADARPRSQPRRRRRRNAHLAFRARHARLPLRSPQRTADSALRRRKFAPKGDDTFAAGEGAAWAVAWTEGAPVRESYVNLIPTPAGGTHEAGLRDGIFTAIKNFIDHHALLPKGVKLTADDAFGRPPSCSRRGCSTPASRARPRSA